jgi:hypothetical protein
MSQQEKERRQSWATAGWSFEGASSPMRCFLLSLLLWWFEIGPESKAYLVNSLKQFAIGSSYKRTVLNPVEETSRNDERGVSIEECPRSISGWMDAS